MELGEASESNGVGSGTNGGREGGMWLSSTYELL